MVKRHNIILAGTIALAVAGAGTIGFSFYKKTKRDAAREASVVQMVERFKACPENFRARRECISDSELSATKTEAERDRDEGRFEDAARKFARIGMWNDAAIMAGRCSASKNTELVEEFDLRREAIERALALPALSKAPSPSAAPAASRSAAPDASASAAAPDAATAPDAQPAAPEGSGAVQPEASAVRRK